MNFVASGPAVIAICLGWMAVSILAFHGIGTLILGDYLDRRQSGSFWLYKILSVSAGMFAFSLWVQLLMGFHALKVPALLIFVAAGLIACVRDKMVYGAAEIRRTRALFLRGGVFGRCVIGAVGILFAVSFFGSLAPATGNDSLWYHLYLPKLYAQSGSFVYPEWHVRALWPSMMASIYAAAFLFQGTALAGFYSWLATVLAVLAVPATVYSFTRDRAAAAASALFIALVPAVWMQSIYAYVDTAMMLYAFLAFVTLWIWRARGWGRRDGFVAGVIFAALLSVKLFTLIHAAILVLFFALSFARSSLSKRAKAVSLGVFGLTVLAAAGFWFVRSWALAGNPVFPFLSGLFGGNGFSQRMVGFAILPKTPLNLALSPWNVSMQSDIFGGEPVGALFLAALPLFFLVRKLDDFSKSALTFAAFSYAAWLATIQHTRFLLPMVPFLSAASGAALAAWLADKSRARKAMAVALAALAALQFGLAAYYPARFARAGLGLEPASHFLEQNERSYSFMKKIEPLTGPEDVILYLGGEYRMFYSPGKPVFKSPPWVWEYLMKKNGTTFAEWIRREGVTRFVVLSKDGFKTPADALEPGEDAGTVVELLRHQTTVNGETSYYTYWKAAS